MKDELLEVMVGTSNASQLVYNDGEIYQIIERDGKAIRKQLSNEQIGKWMKVYGRWSTTLIEVDEDDIEDIGDIDDIGGEIVDSDKELDKNLKEDSDSRAPWYILRFGEGEMLQGNDASFFDNICNCGHEHKYHMNDNCLRCPCMKIVEANYDMEMRKVDKN